MILTSKQVGKHQFASQNMLQFTFLGSGISINFSMRLQKFLEFQGEERLKSPKNSEIPERPMKKNLQSRDASAPFHPLLALKLLRVTHIEKVWTTLIVNSRPLCLIQVRNCAF